MNRVLVSLILGVGIVEGASAGTQDQAVVALHVNAHQDAVRKACPGQINSKTGIRESEDPNTLGRDCSGYAVWSNLARTDVYIVVANARRNPGIAGVSLGIEYGYNIHAVGWQLCADLEFPNGSWPRSGSGNRITWASRTRCQDGSAPSDDIAVGRVGHGRDFGPGRFNVHAIVGALYMYSYLGYPDILQVTKNNGIATPEFKVADCNASDSDIDENQDAGAVGYQGESGYSPCVQITPAEKTTWGAIKSRSR